MDTPTTPQPSSNPTPAEQKQQATDFLQSLLNKNLRVTTTDGRMFWGSFKCTDSESNLVLQHTYEYRHPTPQQVSKAAAEAASAAETGDGKVKVDMISRYLGLVVVPGKYIVQIQVDEFVSQMRGRRQVVGMGIGGLGGGEGVGGLVV